MNHQQRILEALLILSTGWNTSPSKETIKLYVHKLSYADPLILQQAMSNLLSKCKFLPSFAEIEEEYKELDNYVNAIEKPMTAQEAFGKVERIVSAYSYDHGLEHLDGITKTAAETIWSAFNPRSGGDYNRAACMSQFVRCYDELAKRAERKQELASLTKNEGLLLERRIKAQEEKQAIQAGNKRIKMLPTGNLIEVAEERKPPVDVAKLIDKSEISKEGKVLLKQAIGG